MQIAGLVDLSGDGIEDVAGTAGIVAIGVVAGALEDCGDRRLGGRELNGEAADALGVDAADLGGPLRRVALLLQVIAEALEALAVAIDEVAVMETLIDDHLAHGQRQGAVGTRLDRNPLIGLLGGFREGGVDHHQLAAALLGFEQRAALEQPLVGPQHVHAPEDDVARVGEVMHREDVAKDGQAGRAAVLLAARGVGIHVGRAIEIAQQVMIENGVGVMVTGQGDRLRAVLVRDILQLVGDEAEGLVPGDALELARPPFRAGPQHRIAQAVGILAHPPACHALGAAGADVVRGLGVPFVVDHLAVANIDLRRAGPGTGEAEALDDLCALNFGDAIRMRHGLIAHCTLP